jgi:hypothetical protein
MNIFSMTDISLGSINQHSRKHDMRLIKTEPELTITSKPISFFRPELVSVKSSFIKFEALSGHPHVYMLYLSSYSYTMDLLICI